MRDTCHIHIILFNLITNQLYGAERYSRGH
jgi:hypothetical protein